jgi:hypothetical protein
MQIPSITNFVAFPVNYFLESSWKGKTVQVLGAVSILTLFYYVFLQKAPPQGPDIPPKPLSGRASTTSSSKAQTQSQTEKPSNKSVNSAITFPSSSQTQPKEFPKNFDLSYTKPT